MEAFFAAPLTQLGIGGIFAILILIVVFKYYPRKSSNGNGNGMTTMEYLMQVISPKIDHLQQDHVSLTAKVAALPTRREFSEFTKNMESKISAKADK